MIIYKLKYTDKETAIADLINKGAYIKTEEGLIYGEGIHAVVEIGLVTITDGTYDDDGNVITEPIYADGYHFDIMSEIKINFETAEIFPNNPKHNFYGIK